MENQKANGQPTNGTDGAGTSSFYQSDKLPPEYCEKCGEISRKSYFLPFMDKHIYPFLACKCKRSTEENYKLERENREKLEKIKRLQSMSLLGTHYRDVSFGNTDIGFNSGFDRAFKACKGYAENFGKASSQNSGIYLFGDKGVGKTHLTACIANRLLGNAIPVLFTSLFEISNEIKKTFRKDSRETQQSLMNRFNHVDCLIFDDLGTEIFRKSEQDTWQQELLYNLINSRLNADKPTIFTSNYAIGELEEKRKINGRTVDRIYAMTKNAKFEIRGESMRTKPQQMDFYSDGDMKF